MARLFAFSRVNTLTCRQRLWYDEILVIVATYRILKSNYNNISEGFIMSIIFSTIATTTTTVMLTNMITWRITNIWQNKYVFYIAITRQAGNAWDAPNIIFLHITTKLKCYKNSHHYVDVPHVPHSWHLMPCAFNHNYMLAYTWPTSMGGASLTNEVPGVM